MENNLILEKFMGEFLNYPIQNTKGVRGSQEEDLVNMISSLYGTMNFSLEDLEQFISEKAPNCSPDFKRQILEIAAGVISKDKS